jgi:hypothetical protein
VVARQVDQLLLQGRCDLFDFGLAAIGLLLKRRVLKRLYLEGAIAGDERGERGTSGWRCSLDEDALQAYAQATPPCIPTAANRQSSGAVARAGDP